MMKNYIKRKLALLLAITMLISVLAVSDFSACALDSSGSCGTNATYTFNSSTGLLTISGSGAMTDYSNSSSSPFYNVSEVKKIVINSGITKIGKYSFYSLSNLTSCTIPSTVTSIGSYAFYSCKSLTSISMPNSVTAVQSYCFYGCSGLSSVNLSSNLTTVSAYSFYNCSALTNISIPSKVTTIEERAFYSCSSLQTVSLPNSLTTIGTYAFSSCSSLQSISLPSNTTSIGNYAFSSCSSLHSISFPNKVTTINSCVCLNCSALESVTIPQSVTSIESNAFKGCTSLIEFFVSSSNTSFKEVDGILFSYDGNTLLNYPANKNGTSYTIPSGTVTVSGYAFAYNQKLYTLNFGSTVNNIGTYTCYNSNMHNVILNNNISTIKSHCFAECQSLSSVTFGNKVSIIDEAAFSHCSALTSISIPSSVSIIEEEAFLKCTSLQSVILTSGLMSIGKSAFSYCSVLTEINIPNSVRDIQESAFYKCTSLENVTLPESLLTIGKEAFSECDALTTIEIPKNVTSIGENAFSKYSILTNSSSPLLSVVIHSYNCDIAKNDSGSFIRKAAFAKNTLIKACSGSSAEAFALTNGNTFESIGHNMVTEEIVHPSCTGTGYSETHCTVCGMQESSSVISATGHDYDNGTVILEPTCTTDGVKQFTCKNDSSHSFTTIISATGHSFSDSEQYCLNGCGTLNPDYVDPYHTHSWNSGETVTEASCTTTGLVKYTCTVCNESYTKTVPRLDHNYKLFSSTDPTCSVAGSLVYKCTECDDTYENVVPPTRNHLYESNTIRKPTCTMTGIATNTCSVCGDSYTETIPMLKHSYDVTVERKATCQTTGINAYICSVCGDTYKETVPMAKHSYSVKTVKKATCKATGTDSYVCSVCGDSYTKTTPVLQHSYKTTTVPATLTANGSVKTKCTLCDDVKSSTTIYYPKTIKLKKTAYVYNKKVKTPAVTVVDSNGKKIKASNYNVKYSKGRKAIGRYTVTITFKGKYSGKAKKTFDITPKATKFNSAERLSKTSIGIKWNKVSSVSGYQVQVSTKKNFKKNVKTYKAKKKSKSAIIKKGIKADKVYYIRIRTFKTVKLGNKSIDIFSSWSKATIIKKV